MIAAPPNRRRRFRFRLRTLLLLPVLFAAGWWWATWPERTARRFVELLAVGDLDAAKAMCDRTMPFDALWVFAAAEGSALERPAVSKGTWRDLIRARRIFAIPWKSESLSGELPGFVATRNRVAMNWANGADLSVAYSIRNVPAQNMADTLSVIFGFAPGGSREIIANTTDNSVLVTLPDKQQQVARFAIAQLDVPRAVFPAQTVQPRSTNIDRYAPFNRREYLEIIRKRMNRGSLSESALELEIDRARLK